MVFRKKRTTKKGGRAARRTKFMARGPAKRKASTAMRRLIQTEIAREVENKDTQYYNLSKSLYPVNSSLFQDNIIQIGPNNNATEPMQIYQGVGVNSRVGNKIKTKYLMVKGTLCPNIYDAVTNNQPVPYQVKLVVFYDRTTPTQEPQPATNFFQQQGANAGFFNDLTDLWRPYNTDRYRILATRSFKLGYAENMGTGALPAFANLANNDFKMNCNFRLNLTKSYPKHVKFDENLGDPSTRGLWMMFYFVSATGNAIAANQVPITVQWMVDYRFEDA